MILIYDQKRCARVPNIPLKDLDIQIDLKLNFHTIQYADFVIIVNYEEEAFKIIKNRWTGETNIYPLSALNEHVAKYLEYCESNALYEEKIYVTFGSDHEHYVNGINFNHNIVARIRCKDYDHGRDLAFEMFGGKFAFAYDEDCFKKDVIKHYQSKNIKTVN